MPDIGSQWHYTDPLHRMYRWVHDTYAAAAAAADDDDDGDDDDDVADDYVQVYYP